MDERGLDSEECKISCLPPELLAPIFILAQAESNQHPFPYNIRFEVLLGHVSRFWRAISLTTRRFWSQIDSYTPHSLHRVSSYLERSGPQSLLDIFPTGYDITPLKGFLNHLQHLSSPSPTILYPISIEFAVYSRHVSENRPALKFFTSSEMHRHPIYANFRSIVIVHLHGQ